MTTIFTSYAKNKVNRSFARGLTRYSCDHRSVPYTAAEAAEVLSWTAAEESAKAAKERAAFQANRRIDRRAIESQALGRLQAGLCF